MTTATMEAGTVQAKDASEGQEYLWINSKGEVGARTLLVRLKDGKAVVKFWVDGYDFQTQEHTVPGTQMLKIVKGGNVKNAPKPAAEAKPAKAQAAVQAKPAVKPAAKPQAQPKAEKAAKVDKPKYDRIPKKAPGEKTARVELCGFEFRKDYRARLSPVRAAFCAAAVKESCHCRCAGSLHGKDHKPWFEAENALFEKSPNGAITAMQVLNLVKKFGGVVVPEPKPRGRKPGIPNAAKAPAAKAPAKSAPKPAAKAPVKPQVKAQVKPQAKGPAKTKIPA